MNVKEDKGNVLSFEDIRGAHFIFFKEREIWQSWREAHGQSRLPLHRELGLVFMHLMHKDMLQELSPLYYYFFLSIWI